MSPPVDVHRQGPSVSWGGGGVYVRLAGRTHVWRCVWLQPLLRQLGFSHEKSNHVLAGTIARTLAQVSAHPSSAKP